MTIDQIRQHVEAWEKADLAISKGKSYTIDGLTYYRPDAEQVRENLDYWQRRLLAALKGGRGSIRREQGIIDDFGGCKPCKN